MKRLIDDGVEITAIHNHLLRTSPAVFYMHVEGHGDPVKTRANAVCRTGLEPNALRRANSRDHVADD